MSFVQMMEEVAVVGLAHSMGQVELLVQSFVAMVELLVQSCVVMVEPLVPSFVVMVEPLVQL